MQYPPTQRNIAQCKLFQPEDFKMVDPNIQGNQMQPVASGLGAMNPAYQGGSLQGQQQAPGLQGQQQAPGAYPPPYADEAPPPRPADPPVQPIDRFTALAHLDTQYLNRAQKDLRNFIPSDPTFLAHVGALLRALIQHELTNPDRIEADKQAAETAAQQQREAQKAALPPDDPAAAARLEHQHAQADLAIKQAQERAEFDQHQAEQRAALVAPITDVNAPLAGH